MSPLSGSVSLGRSYVSHMWVGVVLVYPGHLFSGVSCIVQLLAFTKLFRFGAHSHLPLQHTLMLTAYGCVQTFVEIPKYPDNCHIWNSTK